MPLRYVHRSGLEDFESMLRRRGLSPDDFELADTPTLIAAPPGAIGPTLNTVFVRSRRNGMERAYTSGGSRNTNNPFVAWVNEAAADIDAGVFG
jgi:hypothetical protein